MRQALSRLANRGYTLVALIVIVAVMGIMIGMAVPPLDHARKRQVEEEVIFRGMQYAEAIRVFQLRQGRPPTTLSELLETEPRSIRQLWTNPLADDEAWVVIGAAGTPLTTAGGAGEDEDDEPDGRSSERFSLTDDSASADGSTGPVLGVYPKGRGAPIRFFLGGDTYKEWRFTPEIVPKPAVSLDGEFVARANAEFVGRPFLYGLAAPGLQAIEGQDLGGGAGPTDLFGQGQGQGPDSFGSRFEDDGGDEPTSDEDEDDS